jgi:CheY-like chemotaxis protein
MLLSFIGATVREACSGREASEILQKEAVDLVVTDLLMPDGDGRWLIDFVRSSPQLRHLPVIMISAHTDLGKIKEAEGPKADYYVAKPFDSEQFLQLATRLLSGPRTPPSGPTSVS